MKDELTASRMRRELEREYDMRVFNPGRLVFSIRLPLEELSHISGADTLEVHEKLFSRTERLHPEDVEDIFIISDNDHVVVDPISFFGSIENEVNVRITPYEEAEEEAKPLPIADPIEFMNIEVTEDVEECSDEDVQVHLIPTEYEPCVESGPRRVRKKAPVLVKKTNNNDSNNETTAVALAPENALQTVSKETVPAESRPPEEDQAEEEVQPDPDAGIRSEEETVSVKETPANDEKKDPLEDEKVVSKILTDFARNKQKKKVVSGRLKSGRRAEVLTKSKRGRYVRYRMPGEKINDIAIAPTIRAAAHRAVDGKIVVKKSDIREKIRRRRISTLINIVFDTSGSMDESEKISITTDVVLALLKDAYQRRDRVSLVTYSGRSAELVLPFTSSVEAAKRYLEMVPFGGTTPMASGMLTGLETLLQEVKREPAAVPIMILVTDGTANVPMHFGGNIKRELMQVCRRVADLKVNMLVVDISKNGSLLAEGLAEVAGGRYYHPVLLSKETLYSAIKEERDDLTDIASSASSEMTRA
ncbi:VWA domain-containing protein [Methanococcoides methylutens]|uniref:VWA domain-containing protein n=1 Tax=Methanococcoides methylutens TaxID=2226 RepID=UPI0040448E3D